MKVQHARPPRVLQTLCVCTEYSKRVAWPDPAMLNLYGILFTGNSESLNIRRLSEIGSPQMQSLSFSGSILHFSRRMWTLANAVLSITIYNIGVLLLPQCNHRFFDIHRYIHIYHPSVSRTDALLLNFQSPGFDWILSRIWKLGA